MKLPESVNCFALIFIENPFYHIICQFPSSVLINDSLIIHCSRSGSKPLLTDPHITELPYIYTCTICISKDCFQLLLQCRRLILFGPFGMICISISIYSACTNLRNQKWFACTFRFILYPLIQIIQIFFHRCIMIP